MQDTILIVDDEATVRQTVREWLAQANLDCEIVIASDAESALKIANQHSIDLAILDWNLGSGDDGLQLLQDLAAFHPDIVAIMITGFANMATPLDAMRMGVRDYLDKNHDFNRESLTKSVKKQLDVIRPAKRVRILHQTLVAFRSAVEQIVPLVQSAATLNEPVPLPDAIRSFVRFLMQVTHAKDGLLLVRHYDAARQPAEICRVYDAEGKAVAVETAPFARSIAGSAASLGQPSLMNDLQALPAGQVELQPFEKSHRNVLAVPMSVAAGTQVVIELFDKPAGFNADDQHAARSAASLGTDLMRQALGQRQTHQLLFDAIGAALKASEQMAESLHGAATPEKPPELVLEQLRAGLKDTAEDAVAAECSLRLAEAIRLLATKHGQPALEHCLVLVEQVRALLDQATGAG
ncbi:MAG: response regulator [Planctomycetes bacterium]|nr:response regulator [Planctomycetota bacterium]